MVACLFVFLCLLVSLFACFLDVLLDFLVWLLVGLLACCFLGVLFVGGFFLVC